MNRKLEEDLEEMETCIGSIIEILFAVQLLDDGKEQVKIDTMLELPIKELERIQKRLNVYLKSTNEYFTKKMTAFHSFDDVITLV